MTYIWLSHKKTVNNWLFFLFLKQKRLFFCWAVVLFSTLAHFTCVHGNSVIRIGNVGRRATKGGVADRERAKSLIVQQRAECRLYLFTRRVDALGACQNMSRASLSMEWGPETPFLFPECSDTNTDETEVRHLKYAAV